MDKEHHDMVSEPIGAAYPISQMRNAVLQSVESIQDSAVMKQIYVAVNSIIGATKGIQPSGYQKWHYYQVSDETMQMTVKNRRFIPDNYDDQLTQALEEKYG